MIIVFVFNSFEYIYYFQLYLSSFFTLYMWTPACCLYFVQHNKTHSAVHYLWFPSILLSHYWHIIAACICIEHFVYCFLILITATSLPFSTNVINVHIFKSHTWNLLLYYNHIDRYIQTWMFMSLYLYLYLCLYISNVCRQ